MPPQSPLMVPRLQPELAGSRPTMETLVPAVPVHLGQGTGGVAILGRCR